MDILIYNIDRYKIFQIFPSSSPLTLLPSLHPSFFLHATPISHSLLFNERRSVIDQCKQNLIHYYFTLILSLSWNCESAEFSEPASLCIRLNILAREPIFWQILQRKRILRALHSCAHAREAIICWSVTVVKIHICTKKWSQKAFYGTIESMILTSCLTPSPHRISRGATAFYTFAQDMSLNGGATHFTL